jgi:hypothetical protein
MARKPAVVEKKPEKVVKTEKELPPTEVADISTLRPHPRNYKKHPEDQLLHIESSLRQFGQYRNVVVARDSTILAGHGVVEAMTRLGWPRCIVIRLNVDSDSPAALKVVALDNELPKFAETDDRALTEILKYVREADPESLLGTGFTEQNLAALLMVTRPASEIGSMDAAAEWVGMPEYDGTGEDRFRLIVSFKNEEDRKNFVEERKIEIVKRESRSWITWWPFIPYKKADSRFETSK